MDLKLKAIFPALAMVVLLSGVVRAGMYFDSAHGNTDYGVLWTTDPIYTRGHCNQCHIMHDSVDGEPPVTTAGPYHFALFYDDAKSATDLFCFICHRNVDLGYGQVDNYPYFITFGGGGVNYQSIREQFTSANSAWTNCGSKHSLGNIYNGLKVMPWGYNDDPDPCVGCHPPHAAQRNFPPTTTGDLNTCIRLPSKYASTLPADILWGDDVGERMDDYASANGGVYQPPYFGDTFNGRYEPTGTTTDYAGDCTPDYVTFCMECHQYALNDSERGNAAVKAIDWDHDRHGTAPSNTCNGGGMFEGTLRPPYVDSPNSNYILSCLDCHEPHGTDRRPHLLRRIINGELILADTAPCDENSDYQVFCVVCHDAYHAEQQNTCFTCHRGPVEPYGFHGSDMTVSTCSGEPGF